MKITEIITEGKTGPGLWANIRAKKERGAKMRKKGAPGAPTEKALKAAQAGSKNESVGEDSGSLNEFAITPDDGPDDGEQAGRWLVTYMDKNGITKEKIKVGKNANAVAKYFEFKYRRKPLSVVPYFDDMDLRGQLGLDEQGVSEGWKEKVGAGLTAAAMATGAGGVVLNPARPIGPKGQTVANPYPNKASNAEAEKYITVNGKEYTLHELPSDMSKVQISTDDKGNKVYTWIQKSGMRPQYTYHWYAPMKAVKEQGMAGSQLEETYDNDDEFFEAYGVMEYNDEMINESEYQGRKVTLNKPMRGDVKKFAVYVKNPKGNVVKVNFGDPNSTIKKNNPARRKSFRARHNCDSPGPKTGARYWSCRKW